MKLGRIGIFWLSVLLGLAFIGDAQLVQLTAEAESSDKSGKLQVILRGLAGGGKGISLGRFSHLLGLENVLALKRQGDRVQVVIETATEADGPLIAERVAQMGGEVELIYHAWVQAFVPVDELESLAKKAEVRYVRVPVRPWLAQGPIRSEGLSVIGSSTWNQAGLTGEGVKAALLDSGGFRGYEGLLGRELPPQERVVARSFRTDGRLFESESSRFAQVHGTGTAEIVYDIAPGAELYLAVFSTDIEFRRAVDWLIEQRVAVVNTSLGFPSGCFREGGGIFESQLAKAQRNGITWVAAAGNWAGQHWEGPWQDPDKSNIHNYTALDEGNTLDVQLVEFQYADGRRVATSIIDVLFSWDAPCSGASDDYEVVVLRESEDGQLKPLAPWNGEQGQLSDWIWRPGVPIKEIFASEDFSLSRVGDIQRYHLAIRKKRASAADSRFDLLIGCPCRKIEHLEPQGSVSIFEPAISPHVITVGAVHHAQHCAANLCPDGKLLSYSSQGPTKDGRLKPEIVAPTHVSTSSYGRWTGDGSGRNPGFTGTSASSPHVAGAVALVKGAFPQFTLEQVLKFLQERAEDAGEPGPDNRYGAGVLLLGQPPQNQPATPTISAIEPTSGLQGSTLQATISGTNLDGATAIVFSGAGISAVMREGGTATALPIMITIASNAAPGARTFTITTPTGTAESGPVTFTVVQAPRIAIEPQSLEFEATVGGSDPPPKTLKITNAGGSMLSWQATADAPWLKLSAPEGTAPAELFVSVAIAGLAAGVYEGRITITSAAALNTPLPVSVTLTLAQAASGELIVLEFKKLEFVDPGDWERTLREGCVLYRNAGDEPSRVRVTLPDDSLREFEVPAGKEVIVCGDVVHIDTRTRPG